MLMSSLKDEELVQLVKLNWNSCELEKELAKRLDNRIKMHSVYEQRLESVLEDLNEI
jgi:hypothetical protein